MVDKTTVIELVQTPTGQVLAGVALVVGFVGGYYASTHDLGNRTVVAIRNGLSKLQQEPKTVFPPAAGN